MTEDKKIYDEISNVIIRIEKRLKKRLSVWMTERELTNLLEDASERGLPPDELNFLLMKEKEEIAVYGSDEEQTTLMKQKPSNYILSLIVVNGNKAHKKYLMYSECEEIRGLVVQYGTPAMRKKLMNDNSSHVVREVARHGTNEQRDHLIATHENQYVREMGRVYHTKKYIGYTYDYDRPINDADVQKIEMNRYFKRHQ